MEQFRTDKAFTVEEADRLIGELEPVLLQLERLGQQVERHRNRLQVLDVIWGPAIQSEGNPDHRELEQHMAALDAAAHDIGKLVSDQLVARGVRFPPGGLEHGLLDFPTTLDGRWVYLCWRRGEPSVQYWHEITAGFAGREPITPAHRRRMGAEPPDAA